MGNSTTFSYMDLDESGVPDALSEMVEPGYVAAGDPGLPGPIDTVGSGP